MGFHVSTANSLEMTRFHFFKTLLYGNIEKYIMTTTLII